MEEHCGGPIHAPLPPPAPPPLTSCGTSNRGSIPGRAVDRDSKSGIAAGASPGRVGLGHPGTSTVGTAGRRGFAVLHTASQALGQAGTSESSRPSTGISAAIREPVCAVGTSMSYDGNNTSQVHYHGQE